MTSLMTSSILNETTYTKSKKVSCNGGGVGNGHPMVYLNMGNETSIVCPYCSKSFTLEKTSNTNDSKISKSNE